MSVCVSVCLSLSTITSELLEISSRDLQSIILLESKEVTSCLFLLFVTDWLILKCERIWWLEKALTECKLPPDCLHEFQSLNHITIRCHMPFCIGILWNRASISNGFRDICIQVYLGHGYDVDFDHLSPQVLLLSAPLQPSLDQSINQSVRDCHG